MERDVILNECFARDGLQNEPDFVETAAKIALIDSFTSLGFRRIEATSYANPQRVPQFADASEVLAGMQRREGVLYKATCGNVRAVERANADFDSGLGANEISLLASASESHSKKNLNATKAEQWARIAAMVEAAGGRYSLIGSLSVAFACPFDGPISPEVVAQDCARFADLGVKTISLGDTIGAATPDRTETMFENLIAAHPDLTFVAHFHDTRGLGLANCLAAYRTGCRYFDSAFGGAGGHPVKIQYGNGYTGNVATEDLVNMFEAMGIRTGIDLGGLIDTARICEAAVGRELYGKVTRTGLSPFLGAAQ
tara:strand:- start:33346 stop:34281 length:936 start_codon:yes stop_codon:yes gene_type:complete